MSEERNLISLEDFDCWLRLAFAGARFYFLDKCLGSYWIGGDSISKISSQHIEGQKLLFIRNAPKKNDTCFEKQALARQSYLVGCLYLRLGKAKLAFKYLNTAKPLKSLQMRVKRAILMILSCIKIVLDVVRRPQC
jgi:GT2 family glycosyltransferase